MHNNDYSILKNYLSTNARNKVIFFSDNITDIEPIDIGIEVSRRVSSIVDDNKISFKAKQIIDEVLQSSIIRHEVYGKLIAVSNIGILFEHDLSIDIISLFGRFSRDNALFVKWDGEFESDNLYFQSKHNGIKLELETLSHIIL